jgi:hypothetical protein
MRNNMAAKGPQVDERIYPTVEDDHSSGDGSEQRDVHEKRARSVIAEDVQHLAEKIGDRADGLAPAEDINMVLDKVATLTIEECREIIDALLEEHQHDYNFSATQREKLKALLSGPREGQSEDEWELELKSETAINKFYSPYPEVRAVTTPDDNPDMACETLRAHLLGYIWACVGQFVNSLFNSRLPQIIVQSVVMVCQSTNKFKPIETDIHLPNYSKSSFILAACPWHG